MGIHGLWQWKLLEKVKKTKHIGSYKGKRIAIDTFG